MEGRGEELFERRRMAGGDETPRKFVAEIEMV